MALFQQLGDPQTFCALAKVQLRDVDTQTENTYCRVYISSTYWRLSAVAGTSDSDAFCEARCVTIPK